MAIADVSTNVDTQVRTVSHWIGGKLVASESGRSGVVWNPATGEAQAKVGFASAAEVARAGIPTVMMFVQSLRGISHNKIEDTKEEHLEMAVQAYATLAEKTAQWILSL